MLQTLRKNMRSRLYSCAAPLLALMLVLPPLSGELAQPGRTQRIYQQNGGYTDFTYNRVGSPIRQTRCDAQGHVDGSELYTYGRDGKLLSVGNIRYLYDASGRLTERTDGSGRWVYTYGSGALPEKEIWGGTSGIFFYETRFTYDAAGRVTQEAIWTGADRGTDLAQTRKHEYDTATGQLIQTLIYDSDGRLQERLRYTNAILTERFGYAADGSYEQTIYNEIGQMITVDTYMADGSRSWHKAYAYNAAGTEIQLEQYNGQTLESCTRYNADGQLLESISYDAGGKVLSQLVFTYSEGRTIRMEQIDSDGKVFVEMQAYTAEDGLLHEVYYNRDGTVSVETVYDSPIRRFHYQPDGKTLLYVDEMTEDMVVFRRIHYNADGTVRNVEDLRPGASKP